MSKLNENEHEDVGQAQDFKNSVVSVKEIDITQDVCPMTFVRTRLALDRLEKGAVLLVRLKGTEPLSNVPRTAISLGHEVLGCETDLSGVTSLWIRRG